MGFLSKGSTVEVSREGRGLRGPWYIAKILKSNHKTKGKFLIKYQALVSDKDPDELLTESVEISSIRPLPPPPAADQGYEPLDVVEAFHRDGWWKGIVSKVEDLEGKTQSRRYRVVLENSNQQLDLSPANLRCHWVHRGGKWVQSPKLKMDGLKIGKGMAVEVSFDMDKLQDAWFPAIILEEVGFTSFLVEYTRSGNDSDDGCVKETVDLFHIRPVPPKLKDRNFEIFDCVEAFHDSCWKKGTVVMILTHGRYDISFPFEKELRFSQSEIRPCLVWTNGKWKISDRSRGEERYANVDDIANCPEIVVPVSCSSTAQACNEGKSCENTNNAMDYAEENHGSEQKNVCEGTANEMDIEDCSSKEAELSKTENGGLRTEKRLQQLDLSSANSRFHLVQSPKLKEKTDRPQCVEQYSDVDSIAKNSEIVVPVSCSSTAQDHNEEKYSCENTRNAMDYAEEKKCASDREGNVEIAQKENGAEIPPQESLKTDINGKANVSQGAANEMDLEDCSSDHEGIVETVQELPFEKSSSLWEYVNSLDVFRVLPQKLHFVPLTEHNEATREGLAIGHMLNFATLVEMTSKLKIDKSRKVFDSYLEALADLEKVGFDVKAVESRVNNLLSIKARKEHIKKLSECTYSKIVEREGEKAKAEEEINAIGETISELKVKRGVKLSEKATIDSESNLLQMNANRLDEELSNLKQHYEVQGAEPW